MNKEGEFIWEILRSLSKVVVTIPSQRLSECSAFFFSSFKREEMGCLQEMAWNRTTSDNLFCVPWSLTDEGAKISLFPEKKGIGSTNCPGLLKQEEVAEMGVVWTFKPVRAILGSDVDPRKEAGLCHPEQGCWGGRPRGTGGSSRGAQIHPPVSKGLGGRQKQLTTGSIYYIKRNWEGVLQRILKTPLSQQLQKQQKS